VKWGTESKCSSGNIQFFKNLERLGRFHRNRAEVDKKSRVIPLASSKSSLVDLPYPTGNSTFWSWEKKIMPIY
jgi:hypothetical protein